MLSARPISCAVGLLSRPLQRWQARRLAVGNTSMRPAVCTSAAAAEAAPSAPDAPERTDAVSTELQWPTRTHGCGTLREGSIGSDVALCGWVDKYRNLGGLLFLDVRDHTGVVQVVSDDATPAAAMAAAERVRQEWVVRVAGTLRRRKDVNDKKATGQVELVMSSLEVLNTVNRPLPFPVSESDEKEAPREELRLKHRVLDLRRPAMAENLRLRHAITRSMRRFLEDQHAFVEVETPMLTRSTPEGARDYLVPSRVGAGQWYALPQSPQLFKQMLMVAGLDRYYQIARCFRDEDLRADRQPEFTQLDLEVSFMGQEEILGLAEALVATVFREVKGIELARPFPRMAYADAMRRFGSDKPDLRFGMELAEVSSCFDGSAFKIFAETVASGGVVKALRVPEGKRLSNARVKPKGDVCKAATDAGAAGLAFVRVVASGELEGAKALREALADGTRKADLLSACQAGEGDLLLFAAGKPAVVNKSLDAVRQFLGDSLGEIDTAAHSMTWIVDWPMFERNEEVGRLEALHHPFTAPQGAATREALPNALAHAFDLVYNGVEVGGGSLRIYRRDVQAAVFDAIGLTEEEAEDKFGFLLDCFDSGAPPHGGLALGLDRLAMMLAGGRSIRDVIAFPKTTAAQCLLMGAPAPVDDAQLAALHVQPLPDEPKAEASQSE